MQEYAIHERSQHVPREAHLSRSDRRILLISSLTLFLRRARHGHPVTSEDLVRLAHYGDPDDSSSMTGATNGVAA
jgi:hypothetical protein